MMSNDEKKKATHEPSVSKVELQDGLYLFIYLFHKVTFLWNKTNPNVIS